MSDQATGSMTLKDVFGKDVQKRIEAAVKGRSSDRKLVRRILWWVAAPRVMESVEDLMAVPISGQLGKAYVRLQKVRKEAVRYRDSPRDQAFKVPLPWKHKFTLTRKRVIDVSLEGKSLGKLEFQIKLILSLDKASLELKNGCLTHAYPPSRFGIEGRMTCKLSSGEGPPIVIPAKGETPINKKRNWEIPAGIPFDPPIRILDERLEPDEGPDVPAGGPPAADSGGGSNGNSAGPPPGFLPA